MADEKLQGKFIRLVCWLESENTIDFCKTQKDKQTKSEKECALKSDSMCERVHVFMICHHSDGKLIPGLILSMIPVKKNSWLNKLPAATN